MRNSIRFILIFGLLFILNPYAFSNTKKPISQQLYEEALKTQCQDASFAEAHQLKSDLKCTNNSPLGRVGLSNKIDDLDQIIEKSVFDVIVKQQKTKLSCAKSKLHAYKYFPDLRDRLSEVACGNFELLKELLNEQKSIKDWIKSYETVNDSTIRVVPKEDQIKYQKILSDLSKRQNIVQSMILNIRQSTLLFESDEVFGFAIKELSSKQDLKKTCDNFKEKLPQLIDKSYENIDNSLDALFDKELTPNMKEKLWQNSRSDEIMAQLSQNELTKAGTICRLESRYGKGAEIRDTLVQIGLLAMPPLFKVTESLAVASFAARSRIPFHVSRAVLTAELALGASLNIQAIKKDCLDKNPTVLSNGTNVCDSKNPDEKKGLILSSQNQNSCVFSATLGAVSSYFSLGAVDKIFKGMIPDQLMTKLGESNERISRMISHRGFYDAVEVVSSQNVGVGKVVTIAQKATDSSLLRPYNNRLSIPDPVLSPQTLIENLGSAGGKLRLGSSNGTYQLPDVALYNDRILKYNSVADPNKKIGVSFYHTKDEIQASRSYNKRFIDEGGLPMAPAGTPGSAVAKTGHLHLHDITAHGASVTIPKEVIDNARAGYKVVNEFEEYLKKNSPKLYKEAKKGSEYGHIYLNQVQDDISRQIDLSTGLWTHFITGMRKGDLESAQSQLWGGFQLFIGARNMGEVIHEVSYAFNGNKKIQQAFKDYLSTKNIDFKKPVFPGTEKMTKDEYTKFLFDKQQEMVLAIGNKDF